MAFKIASSPHLTQHNQTHTVMQRVLLCALPGVAVQCYFFGFGSLIQIILAISVALLCEAAVLFLRKRAIKSTLNDNSAMLTALLLAISIPPLAPWWVIVIGTCFAIGIVKHLYGGLGQNIFNPAMAAYVMLLIAFPVQMTTWVAPNSIALHPVGLLQSIQYIFTHMPQASIDSYQLGVDGISMATPLDTVKTSLSSGLTMQESLQNRIFADGLPVGWLWINLAYLVGGLAMLKLKLIRWQISVGVLCSLFILSSIGFILNPDSHLGPLVHLFSGATMLSAFFIATDPVTAATSLKGRLLFGALIGILVYVIRTFGGYPDAFAFAVLLANLCAPFIDYYVKPRAYGHRISH
ncbi:electron transport complex subunit RsxD [Shewanella surugensis]|uniref:Ion-translocating oxidoreductase complex subunit D n=1 Tax=Shewanella surugensis TaxID=212020 RepID=A0ABT0LFI9_9GAMM|nr:electron transport complex subunit RsxD [Shewanella surugensis]MCL1126458.1 electron transport complex subunit RsxD [Shewanella surugensis]